MYYLMLSRAEELEQIYIEMPEKVKLTIRANPHSLQENENLVQRSIVPSYKNNHFSVFMLNKSAKSMVLYENYINQHMTFKTIVKMQLNHPIHDSVDGKKVSKSSNIKFVVIDIEIEIVLAIDP